MVVEIEELMAMKCELYVDNNGKCYYYMDGGLCRRSSMFLCEHHQEDKILPLSYSSIQSFTRCKRLFYYKHVCGYIPVAWAPQPSILVGRYVSEALAIIHGNVENKNEMLRDLADKYYPIFVESVGSDSLSKIYPYYNAVAIAIAYLGSNFVIEKGIPEYKFNATVGQVSITGFIDLFCNDYAVEFKVSKSPSWYMDKFHMTDQLSMYFIGVPEIQSFDVRIITPAKVKFSTMTTHDSYYDRCLEFYRDRLSSVIHTKKFYRQEFDLDAYRWKVMKIGEEVRMLFEGTTDDERHLAFYQNTTACLHPGECDFLQACKHGLHPWEMDVYTKRITAE